MLMQRIVGLILVAVGGVWVVQGLGVVSTGSFMDGNGVWVLFGGILVAAGAVSLARTRRRT